MAVACVQLAPKSSSRSWTTCCRLFVQAGCFPKNLSRAMPCDLECHQEKRGERTPAHDADCTLSPCVLLCTHLPGKDWCCISVPSTTPSSQWHEQVGHILQDWRRVWSLGPASHWQERGSTNFALCQIQKSFIQTENLLTEKNGQATAS